jgi:hypothetical protein
MTNQEYQTLELKRFNGQKSSYFDTVKDFDETLKGMDIDEQIEWIENGSYGAGACLALRVALKSITTRCNGQARIGSVALKAFYGADFRYWNKLSKIVQSRFNNAVRRWLDKEHSFAMELI